MIRARSGFIQLSPHVILAAVASALLLYPAFDGTAVTTRDGAAGPQPEDAIARYVKARGESFAGSCGAATSPGDLHKQCSQYVANNGTQHAYLLGPTFSQFTTWVFLEEHADGWALVRAMPMDFFAPPTVPW
jgi:hypothetical protein